MARHLQDLLHKREEMIMQQACATDELGVRASIGQGFHLLKTCFERAIVTWLIELGVRIGWAITVIPALINLAPVLLLTMQIGIVICAVLTLLATGITSLFVKPVFAWLIDAVFGLPLFVLVTLSPIFFLSERLAPCSTASITRAGSLLKPMEFGRSCMFINPLQEVFDNQRLLCQRFLCRDESIQNMLGR